MKPSESSLPPDDRNPLSPAGVHRCPRAEPLIDWARESGLSARVRAELAIHVARRRRRNSRRAHTAACLAVLVGLLGWQLRLPRSEAPFSAPVAAAIVQEPARRVLPDGSVIEQDSQSSLDVEISERLRRVRLARGVAHFEVAKDASRPFVVMAAGVEVRAVGTAFSVQIDNGRVEVLVTEGRVSVGHAHELPAATFAVAVEENSNAPNAHAFVDAGQQAVIEISSNEKNTQPPRIGALPRGELAQRLAWRVPRLEFSATPLTEAVALLNRYGNLRLTLADPALGQFLVSGVIRADQAEAFSRSLGAQFGIIAERNGDAIILRR